MSQDFSVHLETSGICVYEWSPGVVVTEQLARDALREQVRLSAGESHPVLVRMQGMRAMDRAARGVFSQEAPVALSRRVAMVADSPVQRVIANFFLGLNRNLQVPTRMFTSEAEARTWLLADATEQ